MIPQRLSNWLTFFPLEVVAVADTPVDGAGTAADIRVAVHKNDALSAHGNAQPRANLEGRASDLGAIHRTRIGGIRQEAHIGLDRKSTRLNSSHSRKSRMPSSA